MLRSIPRAARGSAPRAAAVVLAGSAIALTSAMLPAQAATATGWRIAAKYPVKNAASLLLSVDAVSARDAWAVGLVAGKNATSIQTVIRHWAGKTWGQVTLPAKVAKAWKAEDPFGAQVGASSPTNVWIFSPLAGGYLRLNGKHWSLGRLPSGSPTSGNLVEATSVKVFSSTDVWAFGAIEKESGTSAATSPYVAHFNGKRWATEKVPGTGPITAVSAASSASIWAVTGSVLTEGVTVESAGTPGVLHWTAKGGWQQPAQPVLPAGSILTSVLTGPGGKVLAGGSEKNSKKGSTPLAATWTGTGWTVATLPGPSSAKWNLTSLATDGNGVWAVAYASNRESARLWHLSGKTWSMVTPAFGKHAWILTQLAAVPHTDSTWAVGALKQGSTGADGLIAVAGPTPR
jgi:hypothetical protein